MTNPFKFVMRKVLQGLGATETFDCNAVRLNLGVIGRSGDESCTYGRYKLIRGRVRMHNGLIFPVTNKAEILYILKPGPGSWYHGRIVRKIILNRSDNRNPNILRLD